MEIDERFARLRERAVAVQNNVDVGAALERTSARVLMRRRRRIAVATSIGLALLLVIVATGTWAWGGRRQIVTTDHGSVDQPKGQDEYGLPIGRSDSGYWIAGDLPAGFEIVGATDRTDAARTVHTTMYFDDVDHPDDATLRVTTGATEPIFGELIEGAAVATTVRGHPARRLPLRDDGRVYGLSLVWQERSDLWIQVEAAEGLTLTDAERVADGVHPFPPDRWQDLMLGLAYPYGEDSLPAFRAVEVGSGTSEGATFHVSALIPPRWGEPPVDRRSSCAIVSFDASSPPPTDRAACGSRRMETAASGGNVFAYGVVSADTTSVKVTSSSGTTTATLYETSAGPPVQIWIAPLGSLACQELEIVARGPDGVTPIQGGGGLGPGAGCTAPN